MAGEDPKYTAWLMRHAACVACKQKPPESVHHRTGGGMALRNHDHEAIPMCGDGVAGCHGSIHSTMHGFFKGWKKPQLQQWQARMIRRLRGEYQSTMMNEEVF